MKSRKLVPLILAGCVAILVTACSSSGSSAPAGPKISQFNATPAIITVGDSANLMGVFTDGTGVITPGNLPATSGDAVAVTPSTTTTYTLTDTPATGAAVTATTTVTVVPAPFITSFIPTATSIPSGTSTTLTAVFGDGTGVITPGNIAVSSGTGVPTGNLTSGTTFTLTVTNPAGTQVTQTAQVNVTTTAAPSITSFASAPATITAGGSSALTGVFTNGNGIITPGNLPATSGTATTVSPAATTLYTLTVTNSASVSATQTATVTVVPAPTITSFAATTNPVVSGTGTNLTAVFANGTGVITPGNIAVTSNTPVPTGNLTADTTYTLTVTNAAGTAVTRQVTVDVTVPAPPAITSFGALPSTIASGSSSQLTGVFTGGTGLITPGNLPCTSGTAVTVSPSATTTYTLTVTNSASATATATAKVTVTPALSADQATWQSFNLAPNASYESFYHLPYTGTTLVADTDYWFYNYVQVAASPSTGPQNVTASAAGDFFNPAVLPIPPASDYVPDRYLINGNIYYSSGPEYIRTISFPAGAVDGITGGVQVVVYDSTGSVPVETYINSGYSLTALSGPMSSTPAELANAISPVFFNTAGVGVGVATSSWAAGSAYEKFTSTVVGDTYFIFDYSTTQVKDNPPKPAAKNTTLAAFLAAGGANSITDGVVYNLTNGSVTASPVAGSVASYMANVPRPYHTFTTYVMLYQLADGNVYMGEVVKDGTVAGGNSYAVTSGTGYIMKYDETYDIRLNAAAITSLALVTEAP